MNARRASTPRVRSDSTAPPPSATTSGSRLAEDVVRDRLLDRAEARLAARDEQLRDRRAGAGLDLPVEIDEAPTEPRRGSLPRARLPRAHEPGEREVATERVQPRGVHRSPMRAR